MGLGKEFKNGRYKSERHEMPQHSVTVSKPFYLGIYEVTQEQWAAVMGSNQSYFKRNDTHRNPMERVSWDDVQEFIRALNEKEGHTRYRLPTEAEWEYAARAGTDSTDSFGDAVHHLRKYAWWRGNAETETRPVGQKLPNPWGLYDMYGNVGEWVQDWYDADYYGSSPETDPKGPSSGSFRVFRGGSWLDYAFDCRSTTRNASSAEENFIFIGFRLALSTEE